MIETSAPAHHDGTMRLTINLEADLYAAAVALAKAEDCSISAAVNRLVRRALRGTEPRGGERRNGLLVCDGRQVVRAETIQSIEDEDDAA